MENLTQDRPLLRRLLLTSVQMQKLSWPVSFSLGPATPRRGPCSPTIAYQIAVKNSALRSTIGRAVENDPLIFERNLEIQMQSLIMEPLSTTSVDLSTFPLLVIIDGLDNISPPMQHTIISILADALRKYSFPLMFLVSSIQQDSITEAVWPTSRDGGTITH